MVAKKSKGGWKKKRKRVKVTKQGERRERMNGNKEKDEREGQRK